MNARWIWVSPEIYPEIGKDKEKYCVASFKKTFEFDVVLKYIELRVSADTHYRLFVNDEFINIGPAAPGGDFLTKGDLDWYYIDTHRIKANGRVINVYAEVQFPDQVLTEFSYGRAGFYLEGKAVFEDGRNEEFISDGTWLARPEKAYYSPSSYDESIESGRWHPAYETGDNRVLSDSPAEPLVFETIYPIEQRSFVLSAGKTQKVDFDMIYAAYIGLTASGACELEIMLKETREVGNRVEKVKFTSAGRFRSFRMHSVGEMHIKVISCEKDSVIEPVLYFSHYPIKAVGSLKTSDEGINSVYELCRHTLNICRQSIHLDSPMHQELLACTGDYYIETLMTVFTYGDMSLSRADVIRTANWLVQNKGRMFHTTYSLIWVQMLKLVYRMTGDKELLAYCRPALNALLDLFYSYYGKNGIIDTPPDYMFVDWMVVDGYSMHHPPKYLGQTVLNAFYYKAIGDAGEIALIMDWEEGAFWRRRAEAFKDAFNEAFYDESKGLYFDGLSDFEPDMGKYSPENPNRRAYTRYPNILAPLYGLSDEKNGERLIRLMADDDYPMQPIQPYFMNYLMEAVMKFGLYKELGMDLMRKWVESVNKCPKGLQEGWYKPEEGYSFDHSHAWGGCPAYFIPQMITGLKMEEPGYKKISFSPDLCGLEFADVSFPTPYGMIEISIGKEGITKLNVPDEIEVVR
ncbi:MAG: hypothetical protein E7334_08730 [Clostridiales bacterium]|nr:hypothetical protein [Clostridiales bacterium]